MRQNGGPNIQDTRLKVGECDCKYGKKHVETTLMKL